MWGFRHACARALIGLSAYLLAHSALAEPRAFEVPAGDAATELRVFAKQAGLQILFDFTTANSIRTHAISGKMEPEAALSLMIQGTGLAFERVNAQTVAIRQATPGSNDIQRSVGRGPIAAANGDNKGVGSNDTDNLEEVVVVGRYEFLSVDTSGATGLPVPIEKVPQSISLVSNDFIQAADLKTLSEIAEYTPGAINVGNPENVGTAIQLRGFTPGRAVDGINLIQGYNYYEPDYAIFDRLEIVKGPSSVVYGVSSPGGVVNFVTKSATAQTLSYISLQAGNWENFRLEGQIAGALDTDGHIRAIGVVVQDQGDSFLNEMFHKKTSVYGGINIDFSDAISGYLHGGFERLERPTFDGIPAQPDGTPTPLPRSFCICAESIALTNRVYHLEGDLSWHATDMLDVSLKGNYEKDTVTGSEDFPFGLAADGEVSLGVATYIPVRDDNYGAGLSAVYKLDNLGLKNSFVSIGGLYQSSSQGGSFPSAYGTTNLYLGQAAVSQALVSLLATPLSPYTQVTDASTRTLSAQSMLQIIDPLSVLLGVSYSKPDETETTLGVAQDFDLKGQVSYRGGLNYEFERARTNAYFSYSESFNPQLVLDANNNVLPPLTGTQYEVGAKRRSESGRLLLTGALFQIDEKNVSEAAGQNGATEYYQAIGEVRHRGLELQALGQITPQWQVNVGYAYLDPKITGATSAQAATIGQTQLYLPKQTASLYTTYTMQGGPLSGLSYGGGVHFVSSQSTSYSTLLANQEGNPNQETTPGFSRALPGYTLFDATLRYAIDKWVLQFNAHNIFNKEYFINNYQSLAYGNAPGAPTNVTLSVRRPF